MFQRKTRRFRRRSNGRGPMQHNNGYLQSRPRTNSFSNNQQRNNFRNTQSVEKLFEKYNNLAKEAMSSGDKTLCENYLQHADHFMRIIEEKNKNRDMNKTNNNDDKLIQENKSSSEINNIKQEETA